MTASLVLFDRREPHCTCLDYFRLLELLREVLADHAADLVAVVDAVIQQTKVTVCLQHPIMAARFPFGDAVERVDTYLRSLLF